MRPKLLFYICYSFVVVVQLLSSTGGTIIVLISADHNNIVIGFEDIKEWNRRSQIMDLLITKNALLDCNSNWISSQLIGRRLCSKVPFQLFSLRSWEKLRTSRVSSFSVGYVQSFALSEKYQSINQPPLAFHRKRNSLWRRRLELGKISKERNFYLDVFPQWKETQLELVECDRKWQIGRYLAQSSSHILSLKAGVLSQDPLPSMKWS